MGVIRRNIFANVALSVSQVLFPLLVFPYVSRIIGPEGIGSVAFVDGITQWCVLVAGLGIPIYGVREIARVKDNEQERNKVFSELLTLHVLSALVLTISLIIGFQQIDSLAAFRGLFWVGAGMLFANACVMEWLFQGMGAFPYITVRTVAVRAVVVLCVFLLVRTSDDVLTYYAITFCGVLASVCLNMWFVRKFVRYTWRGLQLKRHFKPLLVIFLITVITGVYTLLDAVILGFLTDEEQVGYYGAALRLNKLVITVLTAISLALVPALSFSYSKGEEQAFFGLLRKSFNLIVFLSVPAVIGLMVIAPSAIALFAGPDFQPSTMAVRLLAPTVLFVGLSNVFGMQLLNPTNHEKLFLRAVAAGMVVSVGANFTLIPIYRFSGAAVASLATEFVVCALLVWVALRRFSFQPDWNAIGKALLASVPMAGLYLLAGRLSSVLVVEVVIIIALAVGSYLVVQHAVWRNPLVADILRWLSSGLRRGKSI